MTPRIQTLVHCAIFVSAMLVPGYSIADVFPVTVDHAFGTTTIEKPPVRVATVAWANHEVPLALGVVPVGFARANFGDDDGDGLLPWVSEKLTELGAETPVLFDEGDGIDFEAVAATRPDVILAAYSGLSQTDYATLGKIAPVIAYRDAPWATDWREMIMLNGAGLGKSDEAAALIAQIEGEIADTVARFPEIAGKEVLFVTHLDIRDLSTVKFYTEHDTRVKFFADLGMASPTAVRDASIDGQYSGEISAEKIDVFADVDILVAYGGNALLQRVQRNLLTSQMPTIENGAVVLLGNDPAGTAANPTPLSITWVLEEYVTLLAAAARKSE